ncbi:hypothetical protein ACFY2R_00560 [Micromonospora olivasterospora]|uniref:Uncharacterized protein n=1 Tax=Micromonospora olivasterospora TaxID=1880 RepID=A0A562IAG5_MICOL|nr:hypothetical protein [Micromonospora olivasterospora]TWH67614.1 hypothetical protein JD77_02594 [Micromonospora olivasterospora]
MVGRVPLRVVALLVVPLLAGCSVGDVRRRPPDRSAPSSAPSAPAPSPTAAAVEVREVRVAVGRRYDPPFVDFVTADRGYALFAACDHRPPGRDCPAQLYSTVDGGRSWRHLRHPHPVADNHQLYTAGNLLLVLAGDGDWYTSTNGGGTFAHTRGEQAPASWRAAQGRFQIDESDGRVVRWAGQRAEPLPAQPPLPGLNTVGEAGGLLVAAGVQDGRPRAAISLDGGRTWSDTPVPGSATDLHVLFVRSSPDGEAWLVGDRPDRGGFPSVWRFQGEWVPVRADGHPEEITSVAPIGGGLLAVNGPAGCGVVAEGRYHALGWPPGRDHYLMVLPDGTLAARGPADVLLATGRYADRRWVRVLLEAADK